MGSSAKRATIYFDPQLLKALRVKAAEPNLAFEQVLKDLKKRGAI